MAVLKCKMCGGDLKFEAGATICECEYCGSKQTIPSTDDEKRLKLYERANRLRFDCEFDKAAGVYENIVAEYQEEAEAYWGLVLCKYGIEYVDDPATNKKIPTCHRSSFESVMDDPNFDLVMENADTISRGVYREEAKQIEEIRKGIIEVSSTEDRYDIFICYKETDENGDRTVDSVIAQDVYDALTEKGYRVFFSRVSLEDKLGQEYEPRIFAALNSAKVMLAFGTTYDYYNAVWVKNEWSRFLQMISAGQKKTLIPCYKDLDAYDMPKEFKHLQAQDMGKVGAVQDLIRGIEKIVSKNSQNEAKQGITEETLRIALKQEAKKRTIRSTIIIGTLVIVAGLAIFAGVSALVKMIKNNKNTTVINNQTVVTEATTEATTAATTEKQKDWKLEYSINKDGYFLGGTRPKYAYGSEYFDYGITYMFVCFRVTEGPSDERLKLKIMLEMRKEDFELGDDVYHEWFDLSGQYKVNDEGTLYTWGDFETPLEKGAYEVHVYNAETEEFLGGASFIVE